MRLVLGIVAVLVAAIALVKGQWGQPQFSPQPMGAEGPDEEAAGPDGAEGDVDRMPGLRDELGRHKAENLGSLYERVNQLIMAQVARAKSNHKPEQSSGPSPTGGSECPRPFHGVMRECFSLSSTRLPWHLARHYCLGMGGDLATPNFLYALKTFILETHGDAEVWLGGSDEASEGHWTWINGDEANTTIPLHHWAPDQPDNGLGMGEHCLLLHRHLHPPLADSSCDRYLSFVCQYHP